VTPNPLAYLRGCAFEVVVNEHGQLALSPTVNVSPLVARSVMHYAIQHKAAILSDLASEEAEANGARSRK